MQGPQWRQLRDEDRERVTAAQTAVRQRLEKLQDQERQAAETRRKEALDERKEGRTNKRADDIRQEDIRRAEEKAQRDREQKLADDKAAEERKIEAEKRAPAVAAKTKEAQEQAESDVKFKDSYSGALDTARQAKRNLREASEHKGLKDSLGYSGIINRRTYGTPVADFVSRIDQIKAASFLAGFERLKGAGAITEPEGRKATEAINRLQWTQSEKEFRATLKEVQDAVEGGERKLIERAKRVGIYDEKRDADTSGGGEVVVGRGGVKYRHKGGDKTNKDNWERVE
jgi:hypothetical protein